MKLLKILLLLFFLAGPYFVFAQSATTEALDKKYDAMGLFFYHNTLRMLNQAEDKAFDELIKDVEKMKFLMIKKSDELLDPKTYKKIIGDYKAESFEEIMTSRFDGKTFDIFVKEKNNKTKSMLVLINDDESMYVLDIVGSIALDKVTQLYKTLDGSADIGQRIKDFTGDRGDRAKKDRNNNDNKK